MLEEQAFPETLGPTSDDLDQRLESLAGRIWLWIGDCLQMDSEQDEGRRRSLLEEEAFPGTLGLTSSHSDVRLDGMA